jgi:hypothetical protein
MREYSTTRSETMKKGDKVYITKGKGIYKKTSMNIVYEVSSEGIFVKCRRGYKTFIPKERLPQAIIIR